LSPQDVGGWALAAFKDPKKWIGELQVRSVLARGRLRQPCCREGYQAMRRAHFAERVC
jgi:hypothetical protein